MSKADTFAKEGMDFTKAHPGLNDVQATQWIHLADAVSRGTISPIEAYDAIELGYVPEIFRIRKSTYSHLF